MDDGAVGGPAGTIPQGSTGEATPLHLIRQREMELSRRVLAAKREADEIIAEARKQAASIIDTATEESVAAARERSRALKAQAETQARTVVADAEKEASELSVSIEPRLGAAVDFLTRAVTAK